MHIRKYDDSIERFQRYYINNCNRLSYGNAVGAPFNTAIKLRHDF